MNDELQFLDDDIPLLDEETSNKTLEIIEQRMKERKEELKRLENPTTEYNEETEEAIKQFANDLLTLYPWLSRFLDEKAIINRVKANLRENLIYSDYIKASEEEKAQGLRKAGSFNPSKKNVKILSNLNDFERLTTRFHEFVHSMVEDNPFSDHECFFTIDELEFFSDEEPDKDADGNFWENDNLELDILDYDVTRFDFISEAIVTLIQEDYERKILNVRRKRVNAYLSVYARQLRAIFGEMLIEDFLVRFKELDRITALFHAGKKKISIKSLSEENDMIQNLIYRKNSDLVAAKNADIEITLTFLLQKYLSLKKGLSDRDKLKKISEFVREQITTDFDFIKLIIEEQIKDKSLIREYPLVNYIYNVTSENSSSLIDEISLSLPPENDQSSTLKDLTDLAIKYTDYNVKEFFGLTGYSYDPARYMMCCDSEKINSYEKYSYLYNALLGAYDHKLLDDEDFSISSVKGNSYVFRETTYEQLSTGNTVIDSLLNGKSLKVNRKNLVTGEVIPYEEGENSYLKISGKKDYYVLIMQPLASQVRRPMSLDKAIEYYINLMQRLPEEVKKAYTLAVNRLNELREKNIETVFVDEYGFIYEKDSKNVNTFIIPEDDEGPAELGTETFELKEIDMVFSKKPAKEL